VDLERILAFEVDIGVFWPLAAGDIRLPANAHPESYSYLSAMKIFLSSIG
jgi:hypothetical protein